ncbi:MAG: S9 family peptidase [Bacteroidota bacterium]|nr:S9 family peptidase [Bacteroidota bacterium]
MRKVLLLLCVFLLQVVVVMAQRQHGVKWSKSGNSYYVVENEAIVEYALPSFTKKVIATAHELTPQGKMNALILKNFSFSEDGSKLLLYTNSKKVWRYETRGDYWVYDVKAGSLKQIGRARPASSLMFAKFSPDGKKVAYVSKHNLFTEDLATGKVTQLTKDGTDRMINGTFDWVYEEEFGCRDGFRWSPDSKSIAYWQVDARKIRNYLMLNTTDSIYSFVVPVEYPKVGENPSAVKIGVVNIATAHTQWMHIPGDPQQHYLPRMEWAYNNSQLIVEQLNRKQNESHIYLCQVKTGNAAVIHSEKADTWIEVKSYWNNDDPSGWDWIRNGNAFLWVSEKDGWRHIYAISRDGKTETRIINGKHDMISISAVDEQNGYVYYFASPDNATQKYLYRAKLDGSSDGERVSPATESGTHEYSLSPGGRYAQHSFSNVSTTPTVEWISLPAHTALKTIVKGNAAPSNVAFIQIETDDHVSMDGWLIKPAHFDSTKKYPIVFYVYTEPAAQTVIDSYGAAGMFLYNGDMAEDGYIQVSLDGRGTPAPKGAAWRKSIYRKLGRMNVRDQAMAAQKILQWKYVDTSRVAVWGWSGGGSTTLHLMFQYPDIYKTGIAIAPVSNQLCYDNIYQERYMGLPQENKEDFINGSPVTYAKNLKGNLLVIHGTGDDNVHYQNTELLINELVKYGKQFSLMSYPNRTHAISEGAGTSMHLVNLFTSYLKAHCPGGGR